MALIVWAVIEVIPLGSLTDEKDLAPDMQPGDYEGWDFQIDGLTFSQGPMADLFVDLDKAKPTGLEDAPAILVPYPGEVSLEELLSAVEEGET